MTGHGETPPEAREKVQALALQAQRLTQHVLDLLEHPAGNKTQQSRGLSPEDKQSVLGAVSQAVEVLSACKVVLGAEHEPSLRVGLPPRPGQRPAQQQQQANNNTAGAGGGGEFSKLLVEEEMEAELDAGTRLEDVLAGVLKQLSNPQGQAATREFQGIPGLPAALGSHQKSVLASLPALSGHFQGLTPRRALVLQREIEGKFLPASSGRDRVMQAEGEEETELSQQQQEQQQQQQQLGLKRLGGEEDEETGPANKKSKKSPPVEEPAGCYLPDDGWEWRKYGRKQMHGQTFPRSYFKCARAGRDACQAKKQAERCSDDPTKWRVRYIGKHSHEQPPPRPVTITIVQDTAGSTVPAGNAPGSSTEHAGPLLFPSGPGGGGDVAKVESQGHGMELLNGSGGFSFGSPTPFPPTLRQEAQREEGGFGDRTPTLALGLPGREEPRPPFEINDNVIDNLPPIDVVGVIMPKLDEEEEAAADRSPAETEFEELSNPTTPLGGGIWGRQCLGRCRASPSTSCLGCRRWSSASPRTFENLFQRCPAPTQMLQNKSNPLPRRQMTAWTT